MGWDGIGWDGMGWEWKSCDGSRMDVLIRFHQQSDVLLTSYCLLPATCYLHSFAHRVVCIPPHAIPEMEAPFVPAHTSITVGPMMEAPPRGLATCNHTVTDLTDTTKISLPTFILFTYSSASKLKAFGF